MGSARSTAISRTGVTLATRRWEPSRPPRAAMLILHGLGEHSGRWDHVGDYFAERGFDVYAYDHRGHGASGGRRMDIVDWSLFLDDVQDQLGPLTTGELPTVLYGHSMGGLMAVDYACSNRTLPDLLVASAPALVGGRAWQRAVAPLAARLAPRLEMPTAIKGEQLSRDPAVGEAYFADPLVFTKATTRLGAQIFAAQDRLGAGLFRLALPTLVIHGGGDTIVPPDSSLVLAELPGVERVLFPQARHEPHNDPERDKVLATAAGWLEARLSEMEGPTTA